MDVRYSAELGTAVGQNPRQRDPVQIKEMDHPVVGKIGCLLVYSLVEATAA